MNGRLEKIKGHPGIYRRGGRYVAVCRVNGRQKKLFARTLSEAKARRPPCRRMSAAGNIANSRRRGSPSTPPPGSTPTTAARRGLNADTRADYRKALERNAIPALGNLRLSEVEPRDIKALARRIADQGVSASTVRLQLAPVRACLADAFEEGLIRSNPAAGVRIVGEDQEQEQESEVRALTDKQLAALLAELPDEWGRFTHS
jgi:hypothetical protein